MRGFHLLQLYLLDSHFGTFLCSRAVYFFALNTTLQLVSLVATALNVTVVPLVPTIVVWHCSHGIWSVNFVCLCSLHSSSTLVALVATVGWSGFATFLTLVVTRLRLCASFTRLDFKHALYICERFARVHSGLITTEIRYLLFDGYLVSQVCLTVCHCSYWARRDVFYRSVISLLIRVWIWPLIVKVGWRDKSQKLFTNFFPSVDLNHSTNLNN